jgi:PleD family two-component response regulator
MTLEVRAASDDLSTLPAFQTERFEVIFVDFLMLSIGGLEIAAVVRRCGS